MTRTPRTARPVGPAAPVLSRRALGLGALALPLLAACSGGAGSSTLRAGSTGQSFPNSYQEDGKLIGYDVEVLEAIAAKLDKTVQWTNADFSGLMGQLEAKKLDTVANNVAMTAEREQQYSFTEPYAYMGATIVALESNTEVNALEDLAGKTIGGVLGSNNVTHLETWMSETGTDLEIRTYETRDGAMQDVLAGRIDGYINSTGILLAEIKRSGAPLKFVGEPIAWEAVGLPFAKDSELVAQANEQIAALREDGTLTELAQKYFGDDVSAQPEGYTGS